MITFRTPLRLRSLIAPALGLAVATTAMSLAPQANAQEAARVESETRPNFGVLLDPPAPRRSRATTHRRWTSRDHRPGYYPGPGPHDGRPYPAGGEQVVLVDCGGNPGSGAIEDAVRRVSPGGTLILRARGGPCVGWLNINKPLTIIGEGGFDPRDWNRQPTASLQAPDGLPCMTVAQGVRVEVRDVVFSSQRAGDAACVIGYGAEVLMNRVGFRHVGDEAAIYMDGGLLDIRNAVLETQTVAPAIVADGASLTAWEVVVTGAHVGMELIPGPGQTARVDSTTLKGIGAPNSFGPRSIGMIIRSGRDYGRVEITNTAICGYVEGVAVEGASVDIQGSRVCRSDKGVVVYNGELTLTDTRIRAESVGVAVASGRAVITNNVFSGVREVIYGEDRASIEASGNRVWSRHVCRARFRERYRGRYEPYWSGGQGWECVYGSYPRDWWAEEDGLLGLDYYDDGYSLQGYDSYQDGYGWYDRDGRYIEDRDYYGDDRWNDRRRRGFW